MQILIMFEKETCIEYLNSITNKQTRTFDRELCSHSAKHSFVLILAKPLVEKLQICIFLESRIKLDYTGLYWIIIDLVG